jgi:cytochrome c-type biogenesis protein CcmH
VTVAAPPSAARRRVTPPWLGFVALLVVLGVALAVGSGAFSTASPSAAARAAALEAQVRCPSCEDVSVAQSSASTAIAVRHQIATMVARGDSDQQILTSLTDRYGTSILLRPPASGLGAVVYVVPAIAGALAVGGLAVLFWRRQRELTRLRGGAR